MRTEDGMHYGDVLYAVDFPYFAQVASLNAITMAALAMAPAPPAMVKAEVAVSMDTTGMDRRPTARYRQVARHHRAEVEQ